MISRKLIIPSSFLLFLFIYNSCIERFNKGCEEFADPLYPIIILKNESNDTLLKIGIASELYYKNFEGRITAKFETDTNLFYDLNIKRDSIIEYNVKPILYTHSGKESKFIINVYSDEYNYVSDTSLVDVYKYEVCNTVAYRSDDIIIINLEKI